MALEISSAFGETLKTTAGARAALAVASRVPPELLRSFRQALQLKNFVSGALGLDSIQNIPLDLLGGLAPAQAQQMYTDMIGAKPAKKNLFYIQMVDYNPPPISGKSGSFPWLFNLFALDVSYGPVTMQGDKIAIGAAVIDRLTGSEATEMSITTLDDQNGTLKKWFDGKAEQMAHSDGTFGLPSEYWLDIEVLHAFALPTVAGADTAYTVKKKMRCHSIQHEVSRRDQAMAELSMTFHQVDTFLGVA